MLRRAIEITLTKEKSKEINWGRSFVVIVQNTGYPKELGLSYFMP